MINYIKRILSNAILFFLFIISLFSCKNEDSIVVCGIVKEINYKHLGKGNYNQEVNYTYSYNSKTYNNIEIYNFNWQGSYSEGDSIKVRFNSLSPEKSKIVGKLHHPKKVEPIKLNSK